MWGRLGSTLGTFAATAALVACGSSTEREAPSTEQLIANACGNLATASCGTEANTAECKQNLAQKQTDAIAEGCEAELDAYLACIAQSPVGCESYDDTGSHPYFASECSELSSEFTQCWSHLPSGCMIGVGVPSSGGGCTLLCTGVKASCEGPDPNGPVSCTCDEGPHVGVTFEATNCASNLSWATGHACNY